MDLGTHEVGCHHRHRDAATGELDAQRVKEADHRVLGRRIAGARRDADQPRDARDRDNATAGGRERRQRAAREPRRTQEIQAHEALEQVHVLELVEPGPHGGAGIQHQRVDRAMVAECGVRERLAVGAHGGIAGHDQCLRAVPAALVGERFESCGVARRQHEPRSGAR